MAESQDKRCALDVNVLLDLAEGRDFALNFFGVVKEKYCPLYLCPTALIELELLARDASAERKKAALTSIASLHKWGISVFDLTSVGHGCTKEFADRLIRKGYLPEEEFNDGLIVGESGCFGLPILVTSDSHLLSISASALAAELRESDFAPTCVCSPRKIVQIASRH